MGKPTRKKSETRDRVPQAEEWFVLERSAEGSVSLVSAAAVICEPSVQVGETVTFFLNGLTYDGIVRGHSGDYDAMRDLQNEHIEKMKKNKPMKKEASFHEDKPRKAALRARDIVSISCGLKRPLSSSNSIPQPGPSKKAKEIPRGNDEGSCSNINASLVQSIPESEQFRQLDEVEADWGDEKEDCFKKDEIDSAGSDDELTEEDLQVLKKIAAKHKNYDIKTLLNLGASRMEGPQQSSKSQLLPDVESEKVRHKKDKKTDKRKDKKRDKVKHRKKDRKAEKENKGHDRRKLMESKLKTNQQKVSRPPRRPRQLSDRVAFTGQMFCCQADDPGVVELTSGSGIYINKDGHKMAKERSASVTAYARKLMALVFTDKALLACSVGGNRASGANAVARPALNDKAVHLIVEKAKARAASKKDWSMPTDGIIRQSMNGLLVERRGKLRAEKDFEKQMEEISKKEETEKPIEETKGEKGNQDGDIDHEDGNEKKQSIEDNQERKEDHDQKDGKEDTGAIENTSTDDEDDSSSSASDSSSVSDLSSE